MANNNLLNLSPSKVLRSFSFKNRKINQAVQINTFIIINKTISQQIFFLILKMFPANRSFYESNIKSALGINNFVCHLEGTYSAVVLVSIFLLGNNLIFTISTLTFTLELTLPKIPIAT